MLSALFRRAFRLIIRTEEPGEEQNAQETSGDPATEEIQPSLPLDQIHAEQSTAEAVHSTSGDGNIGKESHKSGEEEDKASPPEPWHRAFLPFLPIRTMLSALFSRVFRLVRRGEAVGQAQNAQETFGDQVIDEDEIQSSVSLEQIHAEQSTVEATPSSFIPSEVPANYGNPVADLDEIQPSFSLEQLHVEESTDEAKACSIFPSEVPANYGDQVADRDEIQPSLSLEQLHVEQSTVEASSSIIPSEVPGNYGDQVADLNEIQPSFSLEQLHVEESTAEAKPSSIIPSEVPCNYGDQVADLNEIQPSFSLEQLHVEESTAQAPGSVSGDGDIENEFQNFMWKEANAKPLEPCQCHRALLETLCNEHVWGDLFCDRLKNHVGYCAKLWTYYMVDIQLNCGHITKICYLTCRSPCDGILPNNKSCGLPCHFGKSCQEVRPWIGK